MRIGAATKEISHMAGRTLEWRIVVERQKERERGHQGTCRKQIKYSQQATKCTTAHEDKNNKTQIDDYNIENML